MAQLAQQDMSLNLLGAVVIFIWGSHTIQRKNVNSKICCSWTFIEEICPSEEALKNVLEELSLFSYSLQVALAQSVHCEEIHSFHTFPKMCFIRIQEDITAQFVFHGDVAMTVLTSENNEKKLHLYLYLKRLEGKNQFQGLLEINFNDAISHSYARGVL